LATYQPRIIERATGPEQRFDANILSVEGMDGATIVAFGDLVPQDGVPLNRGTPIHSLILRDLAQSAAEEPFGRHEARRGRTRGSL